MGKVIDIAGPRRSPAPRIVRVAAKQWANSWENGIPLLICLPSQDYAPHTWLSIIVLQCTAPYTTLRARSTITEGVGFRNSQHNEVLDSSYNYFQFLRYDYITWFNHTTSRHVFGICSVRISAEGLASWCSPLYLCHPKQIPVQHLDYAVTTYSQIPWILPKRPDRLWGSPNLIFGKYRSTFPG